MQDRLGIVRVINLAAHTQDVSALLDVVLDVIVSAFVGELSHFYFFTGELLVQIVQVQRRRRQFLQAGREHSRLQSWHWRLELRRDQRQWLVLHAKRLVKLEALRDEVSIELIQALVEQRGEILGQLIRLLQATAQPISEGSDIRHMVILRHLLLALDRLLEVALVIQHPAEDSVLDLLVVLLLEEIVVQQVHRSSDEQLTALQAHVEGTNGAICRETDGAGAE